MAPKPKGPRVTSSRNRSSRSSTRPVTSGAARNRAQRAKVSGANVTSGSNGKPTGTGSARVTTGRGGAPAKPNGRAPRAITNGNSSTMRQIRAKAVQANRQAQGRTTVASRNPGITPDSARGQRIRAAADKLRVPGDNGKVRAAQAQGQRNVAEAQARRGARAAMGRMEGKLARAAATRAVGAAGALAGRASLAASVINAGATADGTLTAAQRRGDYKPRQGPSVPAGRTQAAFDKKDFNAAFGRARESGKKTFTWRGKRYTTERA